MGTKDHQGLINLNPRGMVGRIDVRRVFKKNPITSLWKLLIPMAGSLWPPGASLAGFMQGITRNLYILNI